MAPLSIWHHGQNTSTIHSQEQEEEVQWIPLAIAKSVQVYIWILQLIAHCMLVVSLWVVSFRTELQWADLQGITKAMAPSGALCLGIPEQSIAYILLFGSFKSSSQGSLMLRAAILLHGPPSDLSNPAANSARSSKSLKEKIESLLKCGTL